jgi:DNA-binding response OmpR family regulator
MEVVLIRWPEEADQVDALRAARVPRLLLVEGAAAPPRPKDELEDWIRVPADEVDLHVRVETLDRRARAIEPIPPELDQDDVIRVNGAWVALPPVEAKLTRALLDRYGRVVGRDALHAAAWPTGLPRRNVLDVHVLRLRRRLEPLGLIIRTVRGRGYVLENAS